MILVEPDQDHIISTEKILAAIDENADDIALVLLPGVQYYSGQFLDIPRITAYAHSKRLTIGWDLAHAAGNVPVKLHDWGVDFAAYCSYKYLCAGPGGVGGAYVHSRWHAELARGAEGALRPLVGGWAATGRSR